MQSRRSQALTIDIEYLTKVDDGEAKIEVTKYIHGPGIDEPLSIQRKGEVFYYHADGLGSIVAFTDKKQKVVESYEYDSFGNLKQHGDKVKFTYTGREWDRETGLYYYRARYYDPMEGRFVSKDPIGFEGGINLYSYVQNNPVNYIDPFGLIDVTINPPIIPKNPYIDPSVKTKIFPDIPGNLDITSSIKPNNFDPKNLMNNPGDELKKLVDPNHWDWKVNIEYKCRF